MLKRLDLAFNHHLYRNQHSSAWRGSKRGETRCSSAELQMDEWIASQRSALNEERQEEKTLITDALAQRTAQVSAEI